MISRQIRVRLVSQKVPNQTNHSLLPPHQTSTHKSPTKETKHFVARQDIIARSATHHLDKSFLLQLQLQHHHPHPHPSTCRNRKSWQRVNMYSSLSLVRLVPSLTAILHPISALSQSHGKRTSSLQHGTLHSSSSSSSSSSSPKLPIICIF